jgi:hypothetical protein
MTAYQIDIPDLFDENQHEYNGVELEYGLHATNSKSGVHPEESVAQTKPHLAGEILTSKEATKYTGAIKVIQQWKFHEARTGPKHNMAQQTTEWSSTQPDSCMPVKNGDLGRLLFTQFTEAQRLVT